MTSCHPIVLRVKVSFTLIIDQTWDHQQADLITYQQLIGKLIYRSYRTCLNITFVMGQLSCHILDLLAGHFYIAKQLLRYLKGIIILNIKWGRDLASHWSKKEYKEFGMVGYANSNYAGDFKNRKSIIGYCSLFRRAIIT